METVPAYGPTLAVVAAGRTAALHQLRQSAGRLDQLPLDAAAEVLVLLEPALVALRRQAALAPRARTGQQLASCRVSARSRQLSTHRCPHGHTRWKWSPRA